LTIIGYNAPNDALPSPPLKTPCKVKVYVPGPKDPVELLEASPIPADTFVVAPSIVRKAVAPFEPPKAFN
jgi:hypothetical protein